MLILRSRSRTLRVLSLFQPLTLSVALLILAGCGGGTDAPPEARVSVTATTDGKPLDGGAFMISLSPMKKGKPVLITLDAGGKGTGSVAVGEAMVTVVPKAGSASGHADPKSLPVGAAFVSGNSPLKCTVEKGKPNEFKFEVGKTAAASAGGAGPAGGHSMPPGGHGAGS